MPIYSYNCETHGEFVELRSISERDGLANCPNCNELAKRSITAPNLGIMSAANRTAWARNEKSMHEPKRVSHQHTHACSHSQKSTASQPEYKSASAGTRPWMLGH
ncbi:MAG: FmdB family zinc ribbon protein [Pseudomonadota bacterium]